MLNGEQRAWKVLVDHFGETRVNGLASSRRRFASHLLPDLQAESMMRVAQFDPVLLGVHQPADFFPLTISALLVREGHSVASITPLQYQDIDVGEQEPFAALNSGLWLFHVENVPVAVLLSRYTDHFERESMTQIEIAYVDEAAAPDFARAFLKQVQEAGQQSRFYRGKVLSFDSSSDYSGMRSQMQVHDLPRVGRSDVILDDQTMGRLDQHVFEFHRHREALKRLGQSTRKGILLYGPPGTGKTHVVRYVSSGLPHHTTVLITAEQVGNLGKYMTLARTLQPSIVVLEDVDLVGRSREGMNSPKTEVLLNRLLNEMDGLKPDSDILFILTTNKPEDIEEALASRPGRVDEALAIALPDEACRARLISLYGKTLSFEQGAVAEAVRLSEGASAAFMKEMVRRLAQRSLALGGDGRVESSDVAAVFGDAASNPHRISRRIVGAAPARQAEPDSDDCC